MEWDGFLIYLFCFVFGSPVGVFLTVVVMHVFLKFKKKKRKKAPLHSCFLHVIFWWC